MEGYKTVSDVLLATMFKKKLKRKKERKKRKHVTFVGFGEPLCGLVGLGFGVFLD